MRYQLFGALAAVLLQSGSAFAQYQYGIHSQFGGNGPRTGFYSPNTIVMNYDGVVGRGIPGLGVAGLGGEFANPYFSFYYGPPPNFSGGPSRPLRLPPPRHLVQVSGELPATLKLEFPAPATVWLDDKELPGKPERMRTLASPALRPGVKYAFRIRAEWAVDGEKFEYRRVIEVGSGELSKILVVNGSRVRAPN